MNYRIKETPEGFYIEKEYIRVRYTGWLWWKKEHPYVEWDSEIDIQKSYLIGLRWIFVGRKFDTLEEAKEYINKQKKGIIYHY